MAENNSSAPLLPWPPAIDELPEAVIDAVAAALGDAYDCHRVWSAWSYGTMGPDDFGLVAEDGERIAEIARAAIEAYVAVTQAVAAQAAPAAMAVPASWVDSEGEKPNGRDDLERVLDEWNDATGALPRDSGWRCEVLGMLHDAYDLGAHQATPALPATEDSSAGDLADWRTPTSYLHRFRDAITLVCRGKTPPDNMLNGWLAGDSEELQDFAATHAPAWAQGIGAIEAATLMADQPTEGVEHEFRDESQPPAEVQAEPVAFTLDDSELEDLAHAANQEALSFGVSLDPFLRLAKTVRAKCTAPQAQPADAPYPPLPAPEVLDSYVSHRTGAEVYVDGYTADQMRAYVDLDRAAMAAAQEGGNAAKEA